MPVYSYSRIGCFENCPRQFKFRYIEKPQIDKPVGVEAFMGSMVHDTLEALYKLVQLGKVLTLDETLDKFKSLWNEKLPTNLRVVREGLSADDYFQLGRKCLTSYYRTYHPFDQEITLGLERRVSIKLDEAGKYKMTGFIDRLSRDSSGRLRIQDYKTGGSLPTQPEIDAESQLALYQMAVEEMWPDNNGIELVWHYLQFNTALVSVRDSDQLEKLRSEYIGKIKRIENAVELGNFPTNETNLCNWCEYNQICPAKGGTGVPVGPEQQELRPVSDEEVKRLVDEYVALDSEKKRLDKEIKEIRPMLIHAAESGSSQMLQGSQDRGIMVTIERLSKLPTRSADEVAHKKIRELVEEAGLYGHYSSLDLSSLQKALSDAALPESLTEKLKLYQQVGVRETLRIKKLK